MSPTAIASAQPSPVTSTNDVFVWSGNGLFLPWNGPVGAHVFATNVPSADARIPRRRSCRRRSHQRGRRCRRRRTERLHAAIDGRLVDMRGVARHVRAETGSVHAVRRRAGTVLVHAQDRVSSANAGIDLQAATGRTKSSWCCRSACRRLRSRSRSWSRSAAASRPRTLAGAQTTEAPETRRRRTSVHRARIRRRYRQSPYLRSQGHRTYQLHHLHSPAAPSRPPVPPVPPAPPPLPPAPEAPFASPVLPAPPVLLAPPVPLYHRSRSHHRYRLHRRYRPTTGAARTTRSAPAPPVLLPAPVSLLAPPAPLAPPRAPSACPFRSKLASSSSAQLDRRHRVIESEDKESACANCHRFPQKAAEATVDGDSVRRTSVAGTKRGRRRSE